MREVYGAQGRSGLLEPGNRSAQRPDFGIAMPNIGRIWAIGAVHGDVRRLERLHDALADRLRLGDRVVYLGNMIGHGAAIKETVDELLRFRQVYLARPPFVHPDDILYLRGQQEEIWQKLQQLQFAVNPIEVLRWAFAHGAEATLRAYGGDADTALSCARGGAVALTRWAGSLRDAMRARPGHVSLMNGLHRSAYTPDRTLLFVNTGINPRLPVDQQADAFWWGSDDFSAIDAPFDGFQKVVRGYDPGRSGFKKTPWTVNLDGGCGFGGSLIAACFAANGELSSRLDA